MVYDFCFPIFCRLKKHLTTFVQHEYQQPDIHNDLCGSKLPFKIKQGNRCVEKQEEGITDKDTDILDEGSAVEDIDLLEGCKISTIISKREKFECGGKDQKWTKNCQYS